MHSQITTIFLVVFFKGWDASSCSVFTTSLCYVCPSHVRQWIHEIKRKSWDHARITRSRENSSHGGKSLPNRWTHFYFYCCTVYCFVCFFLNHTHVSLWSHILDNALHHHHYQNTKWGNMFWKNVVHPSSSAPHTWRSGCGGLWWDSTLLTHCMLLFTVISHPSLYFIL